MMMVANNRQISVLALISHSWGWLGWVWLGFVSGLLPSLFLTEGPRQREPWLPGYVLVTVGMNRRALSIPHPELAQSHIFPHSSSQSNSYDSSSIQDTWHPQWLGARLLVMTLSHCENCKCPLDAESHLPPPLRTLLSAWHTVGTQWIFGNKLTLPNCPPKPLQNLNDEGVLWHYCPQNINYFFCAKVIANVRLIIFFIYTVTISLSNSLFKSLAHFSIKLFFLICKSSCHW